MIIRLSDYDGRYRVVSLAKDCVTEEALINKDLPIMRLENRTITFIPDGFSKTLTDEEYERIASSNDYDVFEINTLGNAYRCYDSHSMDNTIVVTNQCNSNCIMCPTAEQVRMTHFSYSSSELIDIVRHFPFNTPYLTITGGEPFMIKKDIFVFFQYLRENLYETNYQLLTNGRVFCSKEYTELYKSTRPPKMFVGIPLHGHNDLVHDSIVQSRGAFEETILGIKNLLATRATIELRLVVSKLNYMHIESIADLIVSELPEVNCVKIMGLEMTGNAAKNFDQVWIDYATAFEHSKSGIDKLISAGIDVGLYNLPLCFVEKNYWGICEKSISPNKIRYSPECDTCYVKDACGGIFAGTIRLTKDLVKPVKHND